MSVYILSSYEAGSLQGCVALLNHTRYNSKITTYMVQLLPVQSK